MKKLKINRKVITIATYTIAILSAIGFAIYPETNAIFKKDNEKALAYISSLDNTYTGTFRPVLNREASTLNIARITLTLPRDDRYIVEGEKYIIEAISSTPYNTSNPETICSIVPSTTSGNLTIDADSNITFTNNENGVIDIECNVEANKVNNEDLKILIKYYEKVLDEERFLFKEGSFSMDYNEYADPYKEPPVDSIILIKNEDGTDKTSEDIYAEFKALITKHAESSKYYTEYIKSIEIFENYINDNNITPTTAKDVLIDAPEFNLLGATRNPSKNEDGTIRGYGFEFDDNFIGYVKTYNFYKEYYKGADFSIYFSTEDNDKIKLAIKNSVNKWAYKDNKTYTINDKTYSSTELVLSYIDTYIKDKNLDYSPINLEKIPGISNGTDITDSYPYTVLEETILDYAYNYLAKSEGKIRVSYYEKESENIAKTYMRGIAYSAINDMYGTKNPYFATILMQDLRNTSSDFYKTVTCRETCEDYNELYYNRGKYYRVSVTHNETDKYNEISITESDDFEGIATNLYDSNIVAGIQNNLKTEGSLLNQAITCSTPNCETYREIHYNAAKDEYIIVTITPNSNYRVNNITLTKMKTANEAIGSMYNIDSINASLESETYLKNKITNVNEDNYYEIHYDGENYLLIKVTHDADNNYNTITITKLWSPTESEENKATINMLIKDYNDGNFIYFFHVKDINHIEENLISYLEEYFEGVYYPYENPELDGGPFYTGDYSIIGLR